MEKIKECNENFDRIKVFFSDDEKLKLLGELLSNKSSRDIIKLLIDKEGYTNEIANKLELKVSLVIHHLQKMESIGLLEITNKKIARNGEMHRFFRIPTGMLILPTESKEKVNNELFKKTFHSSIKFVVIGVAGALSWIYGKSLQMQTGDSEFIDASEGISNTGESNLLVLPFLIIIIGLIIERIISFKKK